MWPKLRRQASVEFELLDKLIETHRSLLAKCAAGTPSPVEVSALAAMLHSFYNGIENTMKRVAGAVDGELPRGGSWHRELLDSMGRPTERRPAVITEPTRQFLAPYLQFRHFFRSAYTFHPDWERMSPLALNMEDALARFRAEVATFLDSLV